MAPTFEGTGTATGQRQTLHLGPGRKVSIVNLTGSLLLIGEQRLGQGFRNEVIGYTDSLKGGTAWCVWTDSRGDQVFGEFRGGPLGTGSRFNGTLLGGTGRYAGVTGEYEFEWQYVVDEGFYKQLLTGDPTDNIQGFPKVGPKTAEKILVECNTGKKICSGLHCANMQGTTISPTK